MVLVEGIDATTSYTIQARHSYTWEELVWDATFAQTVRPSSNHSLRLTIGSPPCGFAAASSSSGALMIFPTEAR